MNEKIMLIDDEKGLVSVMKSYFEMSGYHVVTAYSGTEALKKISCQPDIVLLDKELQVRAVWSMGKLVEGTNKLF